MGPYGMGRDDDLIGVIGGLDALQPVIGRRGEHAVRLGWRFGEVVVVVSGAPRAQRVLDSPSVCERPVAQVRGRSQATREHQISGVDGGLGAAAWRGTGERAAKVA